MNDVDLAHLTRLARVQLDGEEAQQVLRDLERVLDYLGDLASIDVEGLEPMLRPVHVEDAARADVIEPGLPHEHVLQLAQASQDAFVRVPRTAGDQN